MLEVSGVESRFFQEFAPGGLFECFGFITGNIPSQSGREINHMPGDGNSELFGEDQFPPRSDGDDRRDPRSADPVRIFPSSLVEQLQVFALGNDPT